MTNNNGNNEVRPLTGALIGQLIEQGLNEAAAKKTISLQQKDVDKVTTSVKKEIVPVVQNATNQEPWYQSRVILGSAVSAIFVAAGFMGYQFELVEPGEVTDMVLDFVALAGTAFALYGRLKAGLKPIGE